MEAIRNVSNSLLTTAQADKPRAALLVAILAIVVLGAILGAVSPQAQAFFTSPAGIGTLVAVSLVSAASLLWIFWPAISKLRKSNDPTPVVTNVDPLKRPYQMLGLTVAQPPGGAPVSVGSNASTAAPAKSAASNVSELDDETQGKLKTAGFTFHGTAAPQRREETWVRKGTPLDSSPLEEGNFINDIDGMQAILVPIDAGFGAAHSDSDAEGNDGSWD